MLITELFTSKAPYKVLTDDDTTHEVSFKIDDKSYKFMAHREEDTDEEWEVEFFLVSTKDSDRVKFKITDTGDELVVFSTVLEILKQFIKDSKPKSIGFSSSEISRTKLYMRMVSRFASKLNWKYETKLSPNGDTVFSLSKK